MNKNIVIIGGGPAGAAAAALLAKKGHTVAVFHTPKRPEIIVGESLLPAVIPMLKELGVEEEIKSFSTYKPGATIVLDKEIEASFDFSLAKTDQTYAYNVPRDKFDAAILQAAEKAGAAIINHRCEITYDAATDCISLCASSMEKLDNIFTGQVDLIIDASGRKRLLPTAMKLDSNEGKRHDLALFAHLDNAELISDGNIHVDRWSKGWGWRIPLPGRVSLGIVIDPKHLASLGKTRSEQYDNFIHSEPELSKLVEGSSRLTNVMAYTNYQMQTNQLFGRNWALIGDSAGFIDPVFSTGLFLAMDSAFRLVDALNEGTKKSLMDYQTSWQKELTTWQSVIDTWYDGKLLTLFKMGQIPRNTWIGRQVNKHITKHVTRIFTGEIHSGTYSHKLLNFMAKYGVKDEEAAALRIV